VISLKEAKWNCDIRLDINIITLSLNFEINYAKYVCNFGDIITDIN